MSEENNQPQINLPNISEAEIKQVIQETSEKMNSEFLAEPSYEVFNEILELGKRAKEKYGESALGNFLIDFAFSYRTKQFEMETRRNRMFMALRDKQIVQEFNQYLNTATPTQEEKFDEIMDKIDFDKLPEN